MKLEIRGMHLHDSLRPLFFHLKRMENWRKAASISLWLRKDHDEGKARQGKELSNRTPGALMMTVSENVLSETCIEHRTLL